MASLQAEIDLLEAAEADYQARKRARSVTADFALDELDSQIADSMLMDAEDAAEAPTRAGKKIKADAPMLRAQIEKFQYKPSSSGPGRPR